MSEPPPDAARGPQPTIVSGTLVLRPWRPEDALQVMKAFSDPDIQRWSGIKVDSQEDAVAWIACWDVKWAAQSGASWAVTVLGESRDQPKAAAGTGVGWVLWLAVAAVAILAILVLTGALSFG